MRALKSEPLASRRDPKPIEVGEPGAFEARLLVRVPALDPTILTGRLPLGPARSFWESKRPG